MNYFDNMRNAYNQAQQMTNNQQMTPQQQSELHKQQQYQEYIKTDRGIQSLKLIEDDFNEWYGQKFNISQNTNNNNADLLKIIEEQNKKIDMLMKNINGGFNNE